MTEGTNALQDTTTIMEWGNSAPKAKHGLGVPYLTYSSGRIGASVTPWGGLHQIAYYGIAPEGATSIYFEADASSAYSRLFRFQLIVGELPYNLELHDTQHFPFGYVSHFELEQPRIKVRHHLTLLNDTVLMTLEVVENPDSIPLRLQLEHHAHNQKQAMGSVCRSWSKWQEDRDTGSLSLKVCEHWTEEGWQGTLSAMEQKPGEVGLATRTTGVKESEIHITLFSDEPLELDQYEGRMTMKSQPFLQGAHAVALLFASDPTVLSQRLAEITPILSVLAGEKEQQYRARLETFPTLAIGNPILESYFANAMGMVEALQVEDRPGAMRAASMHYWVWGWDTVMCSEAHLISGSSEFVRNALCFYRDTGDPVSGWGHQFSRELKIRIPQAPSAQCLYLLMLYSYFAYTGDNLLLSDLYPFAQQVFQASCDSLNAQGLGTGPALWPDLPAVVGHTGQDCSIFNNSILYQGARCMEALAGVCGDSGTAEKAREVSRNLERLFVTTFWDEEKEYFVDSVDSVTLEQRKSYPAHALLWQSDFCSDLIQEKLPQCAAFVRVHHATSRGFLPYPRWDKAFNGDRNQLGQTWPITDVFDTHCMAVAGDQNILHQWMDEITWFWEQLTIPEAYSVQTVNDSGTPDAPGGNQPFSGKSWYMGIILSLAGVAIDLGGLTLCPGLEQNVTIQRFHYQGRHYEISTQGAGKYPQSLLVEGTLISGSCKVPRSLLAESSQIIYQRTDTPPMHPVILSLHGASIETLELVETTCLSAQIMATHYVWLRFYAPSEPTVMFDGLIAEMVYDPIVCEGKALLPCVGNRLMPLEIRVNE